VERGASASGLNRRGVAQLVISSLSFVAFALLAMAAHARPYFSWDVWLARWIQKVGGLGLPMRMISAPGYGLRAVALTSFSALALWLTRYKWEAVFLPLSTGIGALLDELAKALVARPRPGTALVRVSHHLFDPSFPSGHVVFYCSYFGFLFGLAYLGRKRAPRTSRLAMILAVIPIVLVGISRVYLGAHWPSDVLGSYLLSAAWLPLLFFAYRRAKERWPPRAA
jgi:undecaprenyl-diphosphatase